MMNYKGYSASITYDDEADLLHGEVIGIKDVITFQGRSVDDLKEAFHESVDDYLEYCAERGEEPDRPYSGRFNLRVSPDLHAQLSWKAKIHNLSLNAYIAMLLEREVV